jgi:hypothetical protein
MKKSGWASAAAAILRSSIAIPSSSVRSSCAITCTTVHFASITAPSRIAGNRLADHPHPPIGQLPVPAATMTEELLQFGGRNLLRLLQPQPALERSQTSLLSNFANHSSICGKYIFTYPARRFSFAVFSTSLRRSSTRFCIRRVASLSGQTTQFVPVQHQQFRATDPHLADRPLRPMDTTLLACSPT